MAKREKAGSDERVRVRAYHLWEEAGKPHGRDSEFWARALELEAQSPANGPGTDDPGPAKRATVKVKAGSTGEEAPAAAKKPAKASKKAEARETNAQAPIVEAVKTKKPRAPARA